MEAQIEQFGWLTQIFFIRKFDDDSAAANKDEIIRIRLWTEEIGEFGNSVKPYLLDFYKK